jgi:3',5'-cyclic AMP phosphodiesterase CpdA
MGDWRVLAFDTGGSSSTGGDLDSTQAAFLRNELAADNHKCEMVLLHHPRYSAGPHGSSTGLSDQWQDMMNGGVDVVLSGHDHNYQRWNKMNASGGVDTAKGIRFFLVGSGGKNHYSTSNRPAGMQAYNADTNGVLKLTLKAGAYDWKFLPEAGKTFTDGGTDTCR